MQWSFLMKKIFSKNKKTIMWVDFSHSYGGKKMGQMHEWDYCKSVVITIIIVNCSTDLSAPMCHDLSATDDWWFKLNGEIVFIFYQQTFPSTQWGTANE